jgi:hypothetical protein
LPLFISSALRCWTTWTDSPPHNAMRRQPHSG